MVESSGQYTEADLEREMEEYKREREGSSSASVVSGASGPRKRRGPPSRKSALKNLSDVALNEQVKPETEEIVDK